MMRQTVAHIHQALAEPWTGMIADPWRDLAVAHVVDFRTWQTLDDRGASPTEAADLMAAMVAGLAEGRAR